MFQADVHGRLAGRSARRRLTGAVMDFVAVTRQCRSGPMDKRTAVTKKRGVDHRWTSNGSCQSRANDDDALSAERFVMAAPDSSDRGT